MITDWILRLLHCIESCLHLAFSFKIAYDLSYSLSAILNFLSVIKVNNFFFTKQNMHSIVNLFVLVLYQYYFTVDIMRKCFPLSAIYGSTLRSNGIINICDLFSVDIFQECIHHWSKISALRELILYAVMLDVDVLMVILCGWNRSFN